jgi:hypothetical protein
MSDNLQPIAAASNKLPMSHPGPYSEPLRELAAEAYEISGRLCGACGDLRALWPYIRLSRASTGVEAQESRLQTELRRCFARGLRDVLIAGSQDAGLLALVAHAKRPCRMKRLGAIAGMADKASKWRRVSMIRSPAASHHTSFAGQHPSRLAIIQRTTCDNSRGSPPKVILSSAHRYVLAPARSLASMPART